MPRVQESKWSVADFSAEDGQWSVEDFAPPKPKFSRTAEEEAAFQEGIAPPRGPSLPEAFTASALDGLSAIPDFLKLSAERHAEPSKAEQEIMSYAGMSPSGPPTERPGASLFSDISEGLRGTAEALSPPESRGHGGVLEDIVSGAGSMAGAVPAMALGPAAAAVQFGAQSGVPLYFDVLEATKDQEAATWALLFGSAVGQLEKLGAEKALGGIVKKLAGKGLKEAVKGLAVRTALGAGGTALQETGTEGLQTALEGVIYEGLTDEDRNIWQEVMRSLPPSLVLGGFAGGLSAAIAKKPAAKQKDEEAPEAAQQPGVEGVPAAAQQLEPNRLPPERVESELSGVKQEQPAPPSEPEQTGVPEPVPEAAEPVEPAGSAQVQEEAAEPQKITGIKNRTVAKELEEMGVPLPKKGEAKPFVDTHARAMEKLKAEPDSGDRLVRELEEAPRAPSDEEAALLTLEANRLIKAREAAESAFIEDPSAANKAAIEKAKEDYRRASDVFTKVGTESGRSLNARKIMVNNDYSLAQVERNMEVANRGIPLSESESARVKSLVTQLKESEEKHTRYVAEAEQKQAEQASQISFLELQKEAGKPSKRKARAAAIEQTKKEIAEIQERMGQRFGRKAGALLGGLDAVTLKDTALLAFKTIKLGTQTFAQWSADLIARFGDDVKPYLKPAWEQGQGERRKELAAPVKARIKAGDRGSISKEANAIALDFVQSGIRDHAALVDAVHGVMIDADPSISKEDVRDAISGYGKFAQRTKDQDRRTLQGLRGEMRQIGKLEDLQAKLAVKKTGFERREPTKLEKSLMRDVKELESKLGLKTPDRLKALKSRLSGQVETLERKIKAGDYSKKPPPSPVQLDPEAIQLKARVEISKRAIEREQRRLERESRRLPQKLLAAGREALAAPRALKFSFDLPPIFRQAAAFAVPDIVFNPKRLAKFTGKGISAISEKKASQIDAEMQANPFYEKAIAAGVSLPNVEEEMNSWVANLIPGIKASSRVYNTFMTLYRLSAFERQLGYLQKNPTAAELKAVAATVNIFSGRGSVKGKLATALDGIGAVLSSPRLLVSRLQALAGAPMYRGTWATRKAAAIEYARVLTGYAALYGLVAAADKLDGEDDIEVMWDPRSSDFGKIRVGEKRFDIMGGLSQLVTLGWRVTSGEKMNANGKVTPIRGPEKPYKGDDAIDLGQDFLRNKLSPVAATAWDLAKGEQIERDKRGKPLPNTIESIAEGLAVPISFEDIFDDMKRAGVPETLALRIIGLFGVGVRDFEKAGAK